MLKELDGTEYTFSLYKVSQYKTGAGLRLVAIAEPNGNCITCNYSGNLLTNVCHSSGASLTLDYTAQGRLAHLTDQAGQITTYKYDLTGEHLLRVISTGNITNTYTYQPATNSPSDHALTSVTFPDDTHQYYVWNDQGRLAEQSRDGGTGYYTTTTTTAPSPCGTPTTP